RPPLEEVLARKLRFTRIATAVLAAGMLAGMGAGGFMFRKSRFQAKRALDAEHKAEAQVAVIGGLHAAVIAGRPGHERESVFRGIEAWAQAGPDVANPPP